MQNKTDFARFPFLRLFNLLRSLAVSPAAPAAATGLGVLIASFLYTEILCFQCRSQAGVLELTKGDYLSKNENVVLIGNMGTGKTHTAIALGLLACQLGKRVRFYTATGLANELLEA